MVSDLGILTNGKRVVGSSGHTVCGFYSLYHAPNIFFIFPITIPHDIRFLVTQLSCWRCCRVNVFAGWGHIPVSRLPSVVLFGVSSMSPVCARQKKKCKATYCYLTPIYTYMLYLSFFLFSSSSFIPLILIPVSSHLIHSKSLHAILDVVVYAIC